jgi:hypothetical protein
MKALSACSDAPISPLIAEVMTFRSAEAILKIAIVIASQLKRPSH